MKHDNVTAGELHAPGGESHHEPGEDLPGASRKK